MPFTVFQEALQRKRLMALGIFLIPSTPDPGRSTFERMHSSNAAASPAQSRQMARPGMARAEAAGSVARL